MPVPRLPLRRLVPLGCLVAIAVTGPRADAKAAYAGKAEMVRRAQVIVVVAVSRVDPVEVKGPTWTYRQLVTARVEQVLKGDLRKDADLIIHGDEEFICAQCRFAPGRYLLFLMKDGPLWVGCNWHLSVRPIATDADRGPVVGWYADDKSIQLRDQPLKSVLEDVQNLLKAAAEPAPR